MKKFSRFTLTVAVEILASFKSHGDFELLEASWGIAGRCSKNSKSARNAALLNIACDEDLTVMLAEGESTLGHAIIIEALKCPNIETKSEFKELNIGLRRDGHEIQKSDNLFGCKLVPMYPSTVDVIDVEASENELFSLLKKHGFEISIGHLKQAIDNYKRGQWAASNSQFRSFFESFLNEIADCLGCDKLKNSNEKRQYLQSKDVKFIYIERNEPCYINGLMKRMHPEGSHAGLSDEEDASFRLQIILITGRLLLRRFDKLKGTA